MNVIRDDPAARWLPSRFQFATMRLVAAVRLATMRRRPPGEPIMLAVERGQSAFENHAVSVLLWIATSMFSAAALQPRLPWWIALPLAAAGAPWLLQLPLMITGLVLPSGNHQRINGAVILALLLAAAVWAFSQDSWVHYAGAAFLSIAAVNALASAAMVALRPWVRSLESTCGLSSE